MKTTVDKRNVYLAPEKLRALRVSKGWSETAVKDNLQNLQHPLYDGDQQWTISRNTIEKAFLGHGVHPDIAFRLTAYLGGSVLELLSPIDPSYEPPDSIDRGIDWEWQRDELIHPGVLASNGLHFFVYRLKHRHTPRQLARGKFYYLGGLRSEERERMKDALQRHPTICHRIRRHPNVAENLNSTPVIGDEGWWVVDRWFKATSLAERFATGRPDPCHNVPRLMREIATGLEALHAAGIVMRELAPSRVLIEEEEGHATLTDFELARLLDGVPSVPSEWHDEEDGRYRAPEVQGGYVAVPELYKRADLYSWARILIQAVVGTLPPKGAEEAVLLNSGLPQSVWGIARDCLRESPEDRPANISVVLNAIRRWK